MSKHTSERSSRPIFTHHWGVAAVPGGMQSASGRYNIPRMSYNDIKTIMERRIAKIRGEYQRKKLKR